MGEVLLRYDQRVEFTIENTGNYNPRTSKYENKVIKRWNALPCNINPLSASKTALEFGDVTKSINVIRINYEIDKRPTHAYVNDKKYIILKYIVDRHHTSFYVEEVVNHEG